MKQSPKIGDVVSYRGNQYKLERFSPTLGFKYRSARVGAHRVVHIVMTKNHNEEFGRPLLGTEECGMYSDFFVDGRAYYTGEATVLDLNFDMVEIKDEH